MTDIKNGIVRCVGSPDRRFGEDALRILRALRFASVLGFEIEKKTAKSIHKNACLLQNISVERVMSEFVKILCGKNAEKVLLEYGDVVGEILPEVRKMIGFEQRNPHHIYDVWTHTVKVIAGVKPEKTMRLSALFHDMGKPSAFKLDEKGVGHFKGHPDISEKIAESELKRLKSDNKTIKDVCKLVKYHDVRPYTDKSIRRYIANVGMDMFEDMLELKRADTMAQSPAYFEETIRHIDFLEKMYRAEKNKNNDFTLKTLKINGEDMKNMGITDGRMIGYCLNSILLKVIDGELENEREILLKYAEEIKKSIG